METNWTSTTEQSDEQRVAQIINLDLDAVSPNSFAEKD